MANFALIGLAGYIAPRHLRAIKETGNVLVVAVDKSDSVGAIDNYFPDAAFFTEFERFDRHVEKLRRLGREYAVEYVSICSPNYLHDAHVRFALRVHADAICEKPLVLNPWNLDALQELEQETGHRIYTVLQLRLHPAILDLKRRFGDTSDSAMHDVDLTYVTARGNWYQYSWKGDDEKSGGVATNIGIHFFDMLTWVFGEVKTCELHLKTPTVMAGYIELRRARVRWFLSLSRDYLPSGISAAGNTTYRMVSVDGTAVEFSGGFKDLHTAVYRRILDGEGHGLEDARPSVNLVHQLREAQAVFSRSDRVHPLATEIFR